MKALVYGGQHFSNKWTNGVNDCVFVCRVNTADPVSFTLTPPECHMEIRNGYGTSGTRVTGPVHVGDPLTLLILMRSKWGKNSSSPFVSSSLNQSRKQAIFQASSLVKLIFYSLDLFWLLLFLATALIYTEVWKWFIYGSPIFCYLGF